MSFPKNISESIESKFSKIAKKKDQKKIISLGLGEPDFKTPPKIIKALNVGIKKGYTKYSNPMGFENLRYEISKKLRKENKISASPSEIIITLGAKMALSLCLQTILNKNETIINITPCYPSYIPQIFIAEQKCKLINFDLNKKNYSIDFKSLEKTINRYRAKIILINFPNNPTGKILSKNECNKLAKLIFKKKLIAISDEVYDLLNFTNKKIISIGSYKKIANQVITINSFSKSFAMTGWRIGYMVAKNKMMNKICKMQQHVVTNIPGFIQYAALAAIKLNKKHIKNYKVILNNNFNYLIKKINKISYLKYSPSNGGLFIFVNISKLKIKSDKFCSEFLKKTNVATTPGIYFGKKWDDHVRISLAANEKVFRKGANLFEKFCKTKIKK